MYLTWGYNPLVSNNNAAPAFSMDEQNEINNKIKNANKKEVEERSYKGNKSG